MKHNPKNIISIALAENPPKKLKVLYLQEHKKEHLFAWKTRKVAETL